DIIRGRTFFKGGLDEFGVWTQSFLRLWISATIFLGSEFLNFLDGNLGIAELAASKILLYSKPNSNSIG
ncbi:hypothetical protein BpHYR1_051770, partial [Brachionus plicatilis]